MNEIKMNIINPSNENLFVVDLMMRLPTPMPIKIAHTVNKWFNWTLHYGSAALSTF